MSESDALRERLRKLLELARRGVGGEAENAARFLAKLLKKHGLIVEDLDDAHTKPSPCSFKFKGSEEEALVLMILCSIARSDSLMVQVRGRTLTALLTPGQKIEAELTVEPLLRDWREQRQRLMHAFVLTNRLMDGIPDDAKDRARKPLDPKEVEKLLAMVRGMDRVLIPRGAIEDARS